MSEFTVQRLYISSRTVFDYYLQPCGDKVPSRLILLLHGYAETGKRILSRLKSILPQDEATIVVSPNGPYPMPYREDETYKMSYSWYFYDPGTDDYFIDMSVATDYIEKGLLEMGLRNLPTQIIGFSQGGFFAPILGQRLGTVTQVIGIGCEYLTDEFPSEIKFRIDAIHGKKDEVTSADKAHQSHNKLKDLGIPGDFYLLPESGHRIDQEISTKIQELLRKGTI